MFSDISAGIFANIAPIFICAAVGYGWARSGVKFESGFVSRIVMNVGAPCLIIGTFSKVDMSASSLLDVFIAAALVLTTTGLMAALICKFYNLPYSTYIGPLTFPNTVNMGLPVSLAAFGEQGLATALGIFLITSLVQFTFGIALVSGKSAWRNSLRSPVIYAGLLGAALVFSDTRLPLWLENSTSLLGSFTIPLMLIALGVSLFQLEVKDFFRSLTLSVARLSLGVVVGLLVSAWLGLEGTVRGVVIIQSTMPAAVINYLLALHYQRSPEAVAGVVVLSTALSFITLPLLLWLAL